MSDRMTNSAKPDQNSQIWVYPIDALISVLIYSAMMVGRIPDSRKAYRKVLRFGTPKITVIVIMMRQFGFRVH